jgi:raffinose/stachyose/melibiose transport system permease protein
VLPLLMPVTRVVVLISIIGILRSFDLVKTLTDGGPAGATEVMFTYLYRFFFEPAAVPQIGYAAALAVTASVIIGIVSVAYLRVLRKAPA